MKRNLFTLTLLVAVAFAFTVKYGLRRNFAPLTTEGPAPRLESSFTSHEVAPIAASLSVEPSPQTAASPRDKASQGANERETLASANLILALSDKVFLSDEDKAKLKTTLLDETNLTQLKKGLHDSSLLEANRFKDRLRHIDTLYEGLKFKDAEVQAVYSNLAQEFLLSKPPQAARKNKALQEQFFGDRVELVLTMNTIDKDLASSIEHNAVGLDQNAKVYFDRARAMAGVYRMSL